MDGIHAGEHSLPWVISPILLVAGATAFIYKGVTEAHSFVPALTFDSAGATVAWLPAIVVVAAFGMISLVLSLSAVTVSALIVLVCLEDLTRGAHRR